MYRIFTAIELPDGCLERLRSLCNGLRGARWAKAFHLTLRFIGEVEDSTFNQIKQSLSGIDFDPFYVNLKGVGCFPPKGAPRVIWAGMDNSEALSVLKKNIDIKIQEAGILPENRTFSPHITLARLSPPPSKSGAARYLAQNSLFECDPFEARGFGLYSSILGQGGAIHTVEAFYPAREGNKG